jgi:hypothetical protein
VVERPPLLEGKSMHISVASTHKPKVHEPTPSAAAKAHARPADDESGSDEASAEADEASGKIEAAQEASSEETPVVPAPPRPEPETGAASTGV